MKPNPLETQVYKEARDPDNADKDEDEEEDDSTLLEIEDKRGQDDNLSKITEANELKEMSEHNRRLLIILYKQ